MLSSTLVGQRLCFCRRICICRQGSRTIDHVSDGSMAIIDACQSWVYDSTGIDFMVVLGAFAPGSSDFATRSQIVGANFVNGHINYQ